MDTHEFDIVVIGAGMAGATGGRSGPDRRVALIEAEEGRLPHTGRSAAMWIQYGPPDVRP